MPSKKDRVIHRIAIAFGSKENYPLPMGFYEKGYVNVFDERSTETILKELDTITDFTEYLVAKQNFLKNNKILFPYEVDLLALYIQTGLSFEAEENLVITGDAAWQAYADSEEYRQWNVDIEVSYVWDIMIQNFYHTIVKNKMSVEKRNEVEIALRIINLESRINRMELGLVMENAFKTKLKARMLKPFEDADYAYVFMPLNSENYETREAELTLRCDIARVEIPNIEKVVGIAIGPSPSREITFELHYIDIPKIDDKFINHARLIKEELGYFKNVRQTRSKDMR